jgi:hypothetical protein
VNLVTRQAHEIMTWVTTARVVRSAADCGPRPQTSRVAEPRFDLPVSSTTRFFSKSGDGKRTFTLVVRGADPSDHSALAVLGPLNQPLRLAGWQALYEDSAE